MRNPLKEIFLFIIILPIFMLSAEMMYSHTKVKDYSSPFLSAICMKLSSDITPEIRFGNLFLKAISIERSLEGSSETLIKTVRSIGQDSKNPLIHASPAEVTL
jgi:hypothetical protein